MQGAGLLRLLPLPPLLLRGGGGGVPWAQVPQEAQQASAWQAGGQAAAGADGS